MMMSITKGCSRPLNRRSNLPHYIALKSLIAECTAYDFKLMLYAAADTQNVGDYDGDETLRTSIENSQSHQRISDNNMSSYVGDFVGEPTHYRTRPFCFSITWCVEA